MVTQNLDSIIFYRFNRVKGRFAFALDPLELAVASLKDQSPRRPSRPHQDTNSPVLNHAREPGYVEPETGNSTQQRSPKLQRVQRPKMETSSGSQAAPLPMVRWAYGNWSWREWLNGKFYTFYYTLIDRVTYSNYSISMARDSKKIVRRLLSEGFVLVASKGSHHKFAKGGLVVIVPHPKKDLPLGTARSIAKMAGWL